MSERHTLPRIVPAEDGYYEGGDFVSFRTACCVKCGKTLAVPPGYSCSGHVKTCDGKHILAGWCSDEDADRFCDLPSDETGCVGVWTSSMGVVPEIDRDTE